MNLNLNLLQYKLVFSAFLQLSPCTQFIISQFALLLKQQLQRKLHIQLHPKLIMLSSLRNILLLDPLALLIHLPFPIMKKLGQSPA